MASLNLWWPDTADDVANHTPTLAEWDAELESGWRGSDGSSSSLDDIEGIRVGITGRGFAPELPANHHDYDYRVIRRVVALRLVDDETRRAMRAAADAKHYGGLISRVAVLIGLDGWTARRRAGVRYQALRWFGGRHTVPSIDEAYRTETDEPTRGAA